MKIYRIEKFKTGKGLFATHTAKRKHYRIPSPSDDCVFGTKSDYYDTKTYEFRYGFQSKKHLRKYVSPADLKYFRNSELSIVEYEINRDHVHFGKSQCAFNPKKAYKKRPLSSTSIAQSIEQQPSKL